MAVNDVLARQLHEMGTTWGNSPERPRVDPKIRRHWDALVDQWVESDLPIIIRKTVASRPPGTVVVHQTGRRVVLADNSPAQWAFRRAHDGNMYNKDDIAKLIDADDIPYGYIGARRGSDVQYQRPFRYEDGVNKWNGPAWKLCHFDRVGLGTRTRIEELDLDLLIKAFRRLVSPSNQFLVPLRWAGLGEVPEFIEGVRNTDHV